MSHIDNALLKAQKERDSKDTPYKHVIPVTTSAHTNRRARWGVYAAVVIVAGVSVALAVSLLQDTPPTKKKGPYKEIVAQQGVTSTQKALPLSPPPDRGEAKERLSTSLSPGTGTAEQDRTMPHKANAPVAVSPQGMHVEAGPHVTGKIERRQTDTAKIDMLYKKALEYQQKGEVERAEEAYKHILGIEPEHLFSLNNLGVIYMFRGRGEAAEEVFQRAIRSKDDYVDPYYNLACLCAQKEDTACALDYLERAVLINNDVKNWAKDDRDLDRLRRSAGYARIMGEPFAFTETSLSVYIVREGDRIFDVIRREFGSAGGEAYKILELIQQLNPGMEDSNLIYPGQRLKLPGKEAVNRLFSRRTGNGSSPRSRSDN